MDGTTFFRTPLVAATKYVPNLFSSVRQIQLFWPRIIPALVDLDLLNFYESHIYLLKNVLTLTR